MISYNKPNDYNGFVKVEAQAKDFDLKKESEAAMWNAGFGVGAIVGMKLIGIGYKLAKGGKAYDPAKQIIGEVADEACKMFVCRIKNMVDDLIKTCDCFVAGTLVTGLLFISTNQIVSNAQIPENQIQSSLNSEIIKEAKLPIEAYNEGDYLLTKNTLENQTQDQRTVNLDYLKSEYKPIKHNIRQIKTDMAKVTVLNPITNKVDTLTTTKDHEWIIFKGQNLLDLEEKRTYNLNIGDTVIDSNNQKLLIQKVELYTEPTKTYNFTLTDNHNYMVGEFGVLVHNACFILNPKTNTKGFNIKPDYHYSKHGVDDLVNRGKNPVSEQQYFDDAERFLNRYKNGSIQFEKVASDQIPKNSAIKGSVVYKLKDPNSGFGGFITDLDEIVSFWY
jgi:Pretoxin HINT domain